MVEKKAFFVEKIKEKWQRFSAFVVHAN